MQQTATQELFSSRARNVPPSFIREILKVAANPGVVSFAGGLPNPDFFPAEELQHCTGRVFARYGRQALQYSATEGYLPLRAWIARRYKEKAGLDISPGQILITSGSQQALDLVGKLLVEPGDGILLERPTYLGALQSFSLFEPRWHEATLLPDGIAVEELSARLDRHPIKFFYCIPNFQNPTGIRYSTYKRQQVAEVMARHPALIVEDDPYGDIYFSGSPLPPIYSFLPEQSILLGSFSKTVAPGLRLGWMVASEEVIKKLTVLKQASDLHTCNLTQYLLHEFLEHYSLDTHLDKIRAAYRRQKDVMLQSIQQHFPAGTTCTRPEGGMFTWLRLPEGITARMLLERAVEENIVFVPGDSFYASRPDGQTLRMNFSNLAPGPMQEALATLGRLCY